MEKVVALTVTYNRADKLIKVVNHLLEQSYPLEKIIIIDNNSNEEQKKKNREIAKFSSKIELIELKENTGGAGGFYNGVKYIDKNISYDWIWIMDDDAYADKDCLENFFSEKRRLKLKDVGFLAPLVYGIDLNKFQNYHQKYINKKTLQEYNVFENEEIPEYALIDANAFVGPLISKEAIKKVGYPDGELFIYGDDTEFTYRIRQEYNGYFIKKCKMNHQDPVFNKNNGLWKVYYLKRNKLLFYKKYGSNKNWILKELGILIGQICFGLIDVRKSFAERKLKIKYVLKAFYDGIRNNKGKRVIP